jgi:hypothetical protein
MAWRRSSWLTSLRMSLLAFTLQGRLMWMVFVAWSLL